MAFKGFYDYRDDKNEKDSLEQEKSVINYHKMIGYYYDILMPCLKKIREENQGFIFEEQSAKDLGILNHVFEIKLDEDEFDSLERYTLTVILEESINNITAEIKIIIDGYHSNLKVESIGDYLNHTIDDLENEIENLFKEMDDREERQNSK